MHQSEAVSHLVRRHAAEGLHQQLFGYVGRADPLIDLRGLQEAPGRSQPDHVVADEDRSVDDLARRGIDPRRPPLRSRPAKDIADTGVFEVVGVERRGRPPGNPRTSTASANRSSRKRRSSAARRDGWPLPGRREEAVEIEHDRLDGLHPLPAGISRRIGGSNRQRLANVRSRSANRPGKPLLRGEEHPRHAGRRCAVSSCSRQQQQRAPGRDGQRIFFVHHHTFVLTLVRPEKRVVTERLLS